MEAIQAAMVRAIYRQKTNIEYILLKFRAKFYIKAIIIFYFSKLTYVDYSQPWRPVGGLAPMRKFADRR